MMPRAWWRFDNWRAITRKEGVACATARAGLHRFDRRASPSAAYAIVLGFA
jgi:hypothetical protein